MYQYKTIKDEDQLELVFEDSFTQDDLHHLAWELNDQPGDCRIILDMSSIDRMESGMMSAIIALKFAFGNIHIVGIGDVSA